MSARDTADKLALLRASLHNQHLDTGQREHLQSAVDELELQLQSQRVADPEAFEDQLRALETRWAVEHPMLASVIADTLRKLAAMGI